MCKSPLLAGQIALALLLLGSAAQAALVQTNSEYDGSSTPPSPFVTNFTNSLVLNSSPTLQSSAFSPNFNPYNGSSPAVLNNGSIGGPITSGDTAVSNGTEGGNWTLNYVLNGLYNISEITSITRWTQDYVNQDFKVYSSTASNPVTFPNYLGEFTFGRTATSGDVSLQVALTNSSSPLIAGVTGLQFVFLPSINGVDNYAAYTEIGVFGLAVPEPSSFIVGGIGLFGLFVAARRRKA